MTIPLPPKKSSNRPSAGGTGRATPSWLVTYTLLKTLLGFATGNPIVIPQKARETISSFVSGKLLHGIVVLCFSSFVIKIAMLYFLSLKTAREI